MGPLLGSRNPTLLTLLVALILALPAVFALQKDLAGIVDWHKPLIGEPLLEPTPPAFVELHGNSGEGRVVQITRKNLLAALSAETGEIVWRQQLEESDPVVSFHVHNDTVLLLSGPSASTARLFSLTSGHLIWDRPILTPSAARLTTPIHLGTDAAFSPAATDEPATWIVLSDGKRITRIRADDGTVMWSMESPSAGSNMVFKQILPSGSSIHILALHYSFAVQSLLTSTLRLDMPIPKADFGQVPSIVQIPEQAMIAAGEEDGGAKVIWTEHGRIRTVPVNEDGSLGQVKDLLPGLGRLYAEIVDVGLRRSGIIIGRREDGGAEVLDVRNGKKLEEFENSKYSPERSDSVYTGTVTEKGVLVNRVYWSFTMGLGVAQTIHISDLTSSEVITSGFTFAYNDISHGVVVHAAVSPSLNNRQLPTLVLTTSSSAIIHVTYNDSKWAREEALADVTAVKFIDLGEPEVEEVREMMGEEGFFGRLARHLAELKDLPAYLFRFVKRFTSASYTSALLSSPLNSTHLHRDQFGFQKLLIVSTNKGKIYALDSANGAVVWTRNLGLLTNSRQQATELSVQGIWNVRDGEGGNDGGPLVGVLAHKTVGKTVWTVGYHLDAYTGAVSGSQIDELTGLPTGKSLFRGEMKEAFLTPYENCGTKARVLGVVDKQDQVHIWPGCKKIAKELSESADKLFFTTTYKSIDGEILRGFTPGALSTTLNSTTLSSTLLWAHPFRENEVILESKTVEFDAIASFGRVIGGKSTLYKYLNPHLLILSTFTLPSASVGQSVMPGQADNAPGTGRVYVLDSITGETIWSTEIMEVVPRGGIKVAMVENWLVYAWMDGARWWVGSVELFEDTEGKGVTPAVSSFESTKVKAFAQTFILPTAIKTIAFTTSKSGITTKELVVVNNKDQIASISRRMLDPRRPLGKPTSSDKEEMLIPYDAVIPVDPKKIISHKYQVQGATHLLSSPALVESTSLLFAWGQDLFLTRGLTPSGTFDILSDSFNKVQLLLTLGVLSVGIFTAGPAVKGKKLRMKWY